MVQRLLSLATLCCLSYAALLTALPKIRFVLLTMLLHNTVFKQGISVCSKQHALNMGCARVCKALQTCQVFYDVFGIPP